MTDSPLEAATRHVLNDRRIFFWVPRELIGKTDWESFKQALSRADTDAACQIVERARKALAGEIKKEKDAKRRQDLEDADRVLSGLESKVRASSPTVYEIAGRLDSFGRIECAVPKPEDFGKVIERYGRPTAEQYFLSRIEKERGQRREALNGLLEVVKRLYDGRVEPIQIAFFVRKLRSLKELIEVLK